MSVYDFTATRLEGGERSLADYRGQVLLIVNTASQCGFTPQYAGLESLYENLGPRGLTVLGFPCNQFGAQEPGSETDIQTFCTSTYDVTFDMFSKVDVNGADAHPLYKWLTEDKSVGGPVNWNFTKFLIGKDGQPMARFDPDVAPDDKVLTGAVDQALAAA